MINVYFTQKQLDQWNATGETVCYLKPHVAFAQFTVDNAIVEQLSIPDNYLVSSDSRGLAVIRRDNLV